MITLAPGLLFAQDGRSPASQGGGWTILSGGRLLHGTKLLGYEARLTHIFEQEYHRFHPTVDFSVTDQGGVWFGAGIYIEAQHETQAGNLFIGASFEPGLYIQNDEFDLGFPLQFRSGAEVGIKTKNGIRLSLSYDHRSNGNFFGGINPGMETVQLRVGARY
jgi:hypothetical protein